MIVSEGTLVFANSKVNYLRGLLIGTNSDN